MAECARARRGLAPIQFISTSYDVKSISGLTWDMAEASACADDEGINATPGLEARALLSYLSYSLNFPSPACPCRS